MPQDIRTREETARKIAEVQKLWQGLDPAMQRHVARDLIPSVIVKAFSELDLGTSEKFSAETMHKLLSRVARAMRELAGVRNAERAIFGEAATAGAGPLTASYLSLRAVAPEGLEGVAERAGELAGGISDAAAAPPSGAGVGELLGHYLSGIVPPFLEALDRNGPTLRRLVDGVEAETASEGNIDLTNLAERVALEIEPRARVMFSPRFRPLPPSVEFGEGDRTVRVSPTVGGSDIPDASVSAGVQIDTNPEGEGRRPMTRLTVGVDVDSTGRARGASFGFRCRF